MRATAPGMGGGAAGFRADRVAGITRDSVEHYPFKGVASNDIYPVEIADRTDYAQAGATVPVLVEGDARVQALQAVVSEPQTPEDYVEPSRNACRSLRGRLTSCEAARWAIEMDRGRVITLDRLPFPPTSSPRGEIRAEA